MVVDGGDPLQEAMALDVGIVAEPLQVRSLDGHLNGGGSAHPS